MHAQLSDAIALQFVVQGLAGDSQATGGFALVAVGGGQGRQDGLFFDLFQRGRWSQKTGQYDKL